MPADLSQILHHYHRIREW